MAKISLVKNELSYETAEEIKTLRTNIQFCGDDKKVIMITSCISGEGKSTTALELAKSLAELGKKTFYIDADLRKSVFSQKIESGFVDKGLSHFLSGQCGINDVVYYTDIPNLAVVFSGVVPPNPTELLSGQVFDDMVKMLRTMFDYVVVDCAPLGMVVDAAIVAPRCDGSILLLESGTIKYRMAQEVKAKLENTGIPILGVVLNKVDRKKSSKYYGYGRYYGQRYTKYYKHDEE